MPPRGFESWAFGRRPFFGLRRFPSEWKRGYISGYPWCCVAFFTCVWGMFSLWAWAPEWVRKACGRNNRVSCPWHCFFPDKKPRVPKPCYGKDCTWCNGEMVA